MAHPLWNHQVESIRRAASRDSFGFLFEQGTGKTRACIETLRIKFSEEKRLMRTLILAPRAVVPNWKREFLMYSKISSDHITVLIGDGPKKLRQLLAVMKTDHGHIVVGNYEILQNKQILSALLSWGVEVLVCDESQRLKNPTGVRAKAIVPLADLSKYRYILSGTPILNSPQDVFQQWRILDKGFTFGKNFFSFRNKYFMDANSAWVGRQNHFPKWQLRKEAGELFPQLINETSMRVLKKDCLDLPPLIRQRVDVELSPEQLRLYKEMKRDFIAFIDSKKDQPQTVVATLAVTKALRMQQIVTGFVPVEQDGKIHEIEDVPRLAALKELLEDLCVDAKNKVIVWCTFQHNYKQVGKVCEELGLKTAKLIGGMSQSEFQSNIDEFTKGESSVMIANQKAGGVGINLVEARYSIYYSKNFSLEDDLQSEARNYRGGSERHESVTRIDLVATGTVDELINEALQSKQNMSEAILNWSRE